MQTNSSKLLVVCLILTMIGSAGTQDPPRVIIEKAVNALGGKNEVNKLKAVHAKFQATGILGDNYAPCALESWYQYPTRLKTDLRCSVHGRQYTLIQVINGDRAWRSENGQTHQATGHNFTELQEDLYFQRIETLKPLVSAKGYVLSPLGEIKVDNRPALGVRVASKGKRDIDLYFDKETFLLVKSAHGLTDLTGKELLRETVYGDYGDDKQWMKMTVFQDGKKVLEMKPIEIKFLDNIPNSVFVRP